MILNWDEDTIDLVKIAIASFMLNLESWTSVQEEVSILSKALGDLQQVDDNDDSRGIYPVQELLGEHEVRISKIPPVAKEGM